MAVLNYFLNTKTPKDTLIINLGSIYHATCLVLKKIPNSNINYSVLGRGLSTGTELEYSDTDTIKNALKNRERV